MKKTMITGVRPTGKLTLANYIGGIRKFVEMQNDYDSYIFIADIHGVTTYVDPKEIKNNILDIAALYIACGVDTTHTHLFLQSDINEHANLGYLLAFQCGVGELSRMTQYKSKKGHNKDLGLFIYPTLMAADILMYDANIVPVGKDQRQHIEITRDIAERFNKIYGKTFLLPEYSVPKIGYKILNLQNPKEKMSKSAPITDKGTIFLLDDVEITKTKIMGATTDSEGRVYFDEKNKPGISNLISILASIKNVEIETIVNEYKNYSYKDFKIAVANETCDFIENIQKKYYDIRKNRVLLDEILSNGAISAQQKAKIKLYEVRNKMGINKF